MAVERNEDRHCHQRNVSYEYLRILRHRARLVEVLCQIPAPAPELLERIWRKRVTSTQLRCLQNQMILPWVSDPFPHPPCPQQGGDDPRKKDFPRRCQSSLSGHQDTNKVDLSPLDNTLDQKALSSALGTRQFTRKTPRTRSRNLGDLPPAIAAILLGTTCPGHILSFSIQFQFSP